MAAFRDLLLRGFGASVASSTEAFASGVVSAAAVSSVVLRERRVRLGFFALDSVDASRLSLLRLVVRRFLVGFSTGAAAAATSVEASSLAPVVSFAGLT